MTLWPWIGGAVLAALVIGSACFPPDKDARKPRLFPL
jgi:hypothetical protein